MTQEARVLLFDPISCILYSWLKTHHIVTLYSWPNKQNIVILTEQTEKAWTHYNRLHSFHSDLMVWQMLYPEHC
jgi:hypothetical protein